METRNVQPPSATAQQDTRQLVKKHLQDPNHIFSEEELRNVQVCINLDEIAQHPKLREIAAWQKS